MVFLYLLRLLLAFSPSYIYPDEHFQNTEISASLLGHIHHDYTWEWQLPKPVRSFVPVALTTGWAFYIVDFLSLLLTGKEASGRVLFVVERLVFFGLSFTIDYSVEKLAKRKAYASFLVQTSGVMCTIILHSFSNSIEASIVGLSLVLLQGINKTLNDHERRSPSKQMFSLAALLVLGIWNRFTFCFIALVAGIALVLSIIRSRPSKSSTVFSFNTFFDLTYTIYPAIFGGLLAVCVLIAIDSLFYHQFVLTPLNGALYNLSHSRNFGTSPVWAYLFISTPLLFLPYIFGFFSTLWHIKSCKNIALQCSLAYIILYIAALSSNPHKEARFLVSLVVPFILLAASSIPRSPKLYTIGKFIVIAHAICLIIFYAGLHQLGTLQAVFEFNKQIEIPNTSISNKCAEGVEIIYWKASWLPNHLLFSATIPECQNKIKATNYLNVGHYNFIHRVMAEKQASNRYVLAPVWQIDRNPVIRSMLRARGLELELMFNKYFGPHIDLDEWNDIYKAGFSQAWLAWYEVVEKT